MGKNAKKFRRESKGPFNFFFITWFLFEINQEKRMDSLVKYKDFTFLMHNALRITLLIRIQYFSYGFNNRKVDFKNL